MLVLHEDSQDILKNRIHLPDKVVDYLKRIRKAYGDKYLKHVKGGKILIQNTNDTAYNQKDDEKVNGKKKNLHDIPVSVAKERLKMMNQCKPNSLQDVLMGGTLVKNIMKKGIQQARTAVKPVAEVDKVPETSNVTKSGANDKSKLKPQTITLKNGTATVVNERKAIYITEEQISVIQKILDNGNNSSRTDLS